MSSVNKNHVIIFLSLTTLVGAGFAIDQYLRLSDYRRQGQLTITTSAATTAAPKTVASTAPASATNAPAETAAPQIEIEPEEAPPAEAAGPRPGGGGRRDWAARMTELMQDPDFAEAWKIQQRADLDNRYGALFKQLNLPPAQLEAFKDLLVDRQNAGRDVMMTARQEGIGGRENREQLRELTQALQAEVDAAIRETIGQSTYDAYKNYESTGAQRGTVNQINQSLTYSGTPLSTHQAQQLTNIIAQNSPEGRPGVITDQTITLARGMLTPDQVAALQKVQAEQEARAFVRQQMGAGGNRGGR